MLTARSFSARPSTSLKRVFQGPLRCAKGDVPVTLTIEDWNFLSYPSVQVQVRPEFLPELMPHIDSGGDLCYFSPGAVTLDRYDPGSAIAQCLEQATAVLDRVAADPDYRSADIQDEFPAHWISGQKTVPYDVLMGQVDSQATSATYFYMDVAGRRRAVIATDREEAMRFATAFGALNNFNTSQTCWLFRTEIRPVVPVKMPQTVKELFAWLREWDRGLSASVQRVFERPDYLQANAVRFAVHSPVGWIGFGFDLDRLKRIGYVKSPKKYQQFLHHAGGDEPVLRLSIEEAGAQFVHNRNLSFDDLYNKRVTIVGCGAIGSFVAQAMVRLGAGTGKLGALKLVDPQLFAPENLGRHVLGYPALLRPKAEALRDELSRQFPHSKVESWVGSAFDDPALFGAELIIDATGEESVSECLNGLNLARLVRRPILYVWIRGNGEAVQALWSEKAALACYRCLILPDAKLHRKERLPLLKTETQRRTIGCRAFTPYAVSAPMQAAALATDMVCAWLQGDPSPCFRTRSVETANVFVLKNQDLLKLKECPACSHP